MKNDLIDSIGIIVVLLGVTWLALAGFNVVGSVNNNLWMGSGLIMIIVGILLHIFINKRNKED